MNTNKPASFDILGIRVDTLPMQAAAATIVDRAGKRTQPPVYVVKPYVEFMDAAHRNPELAALLNNAWLSLPDAVSLQWAASYLYGGTRNWWRVMSLGSQIVFNPRALTTHIPEKFGGATFTWKILEAAAIAGCSVYIIGSPKNSSIATTAKRISMRLPNLTMAGSWPGELDGKSGAELRDAISNEPIEAALVADLKRTNPDIILVGMGFPLQELLMAKLLPQVPHGVFIGEGGTFDYDSFGGGRKRAPRFVRHIGLEWLWRLALEPRRLGRQLAIPRFIWAVYRSGKRS